MQETADGIRCRNKAELKMPEPIQQPENRRQIREIASEIRTSEGVVSIFSRPVLLSSFDADTIAAEFPAATHLLATGGEGSNQPLLVFAETNMESSITLVKSTLEHFAGQRKSLESTHVMPGGASLSYLDALSDLVLAPIPQ